MNQSERFWRFVQDTSGRDFEEPAVLLRLEQDQLIITCRWRAAGALLLASSQCTEFVPASPRGSRRDRKDPET
jgi:hypothetical protein